MGHITASEGVLYKADSVSCDQYVVEYVTESRNTVTPASGGWCSGVGSHICATSCVPSNGTDETKDVRWVGVA